jgi:hypothetical protein
MVRITVSVDDLRKAYMPGRAKTGEVATPPITYMGRSISRIVFGRYGRVEYWDGLTQFATFQDWIGIDD